MYIATISYSHTTARGPLYKAECNGVSVVALEAEAVLAAKLIDEGAYPNSDYSTVHNGTPSLVFASLAKAAQPVFKSRARFEAIKDRLAASGENAATRAEE